MKATKYLGSLMALSVKLELHWDLPMQCSQDLLDGEAKMTTPVSF